MKSTNYKDTVRKKISNSYLMEVLDFLRDGKFPMIIFALLIVSVGHYLIDFLNIFNTTRYALGLTLITIFIFFMINHYVIGGRLKCLPSIQFVRLFALGIVVFLISIISLGGVSVLLLSIPYLFYFSNIVFLYFYSEGLTLQESPPKDKSDYEKVKKEMILKNINYVKLVSLGLHLGSFIGYFLIGKTDPLYITTFFCVTPFFIIFLFLKRVDSLFLLYRTLFIMLFFFISTTITPYLFLFGLLTMWGGKFYYFIKYNIKYPSFYKSYDIRR